LIGVAGFWPLGTPFFIFPPIAWPIWLTPPGESTSVLGGPALTLTDFTFFELAPPPGRFPFVRFIFSSFLCAYCAPAFFESIASRFFMIISFSFFNVARLASSPSAQRHL
jgi:hypothetical protein